MRSKQIITTLTSAFKNGIKVLLTGPPQVGKSAFCAEAAKAAGMDFVLCHPAVMDPTDWKGMPFAFNDKGNIVAEFVTFGDLRRLCEAKRPTVVALEDLGQTPNAVQAALMHPIHAREINGKKIPDHVVFTGSTNRPEDRAAVTGMIEPLKTRWDAIIEAEANADDYTAWWMTQENLPVEPMAYIRQNPSDLYQFPKDKGLRNWPGYRTWQAVGKLMNANMTSMEVICGAIGEGVGRKFKAWLDVASSMPTKEEILLHPDTCRVPEEDKPAVQWAVACSIPRWVEKGNYEAFQTYMDRIPRELMVMALDDILKIRPEIATTKAFIKTVTRPDIINIFKQDLGRDK